MPVGAQCVSADAELLALEHRPALVARLGDRARSTGPSRSSRNVSNTLRFVFGPSRRVSPRRDELARAAARSFSPSSPVSEKPAAKITANGLLLQHLLEGVDGVAGEDDREVDVAGHVEDRAVAREAVDRVAVRVHREERGAVPSPQARNFRHIAVLGCGPCRRRRSRRSSRVEEGSRSTSRSAVGGRLRQWTMPSSHHT